MAHILHIRFGVAGGTPCPVNKTYGRYYAKGDNRKKAKIKGDTADQYTGAIKADIRSKVPISRNAKKGIKNDYAANQPDRRNYKHRKKQKYIIYVINAVFQRVNRNNNAVNIIAQ
jgi:hypothetical protein